MLFETAAIVKGFLIALNRITSWVGSGYFLKKGAQERKKRYVLLAIGLSIVMFLLLMIFPEGRAFVRGSYQKIISRIHFHPKLVPVEKTSRSQILESL